MSATGSPAKLLLIGSTGLLGQAVRAEAGRRHWQVTGAARHGGDIALDISDDGDFDRVLDRENPDLVINCAALVDVAGCEADPALAYRINARPLVPLATWSQAGKRPLVQISTDHFYPEGCDRAHDEDENVVLTNEYAISKYLGERLALVSSHALVLRTSIVGVRGWDRPTFAEWAIDTVINDRPATLFTDAYTSSIDVASFAEALFDLVERRVTGLLNLAASQVYSKAEFVRELARRMDRPLTRAEDASVVAMSPPRPASLGLNVARAERYLGRRLPKLDEVTASVIAQHKGKTNAV